MESSALLSVPFPASQHVNVPSHVPHPEIVTAWLAGGKRVKMVAVRDFRILVLRCGYSRVRNQADKVHRLNSGAV